MYPPGWNLERCPTSSLFVLQRGGPVKRKKGKDFMRRRGGGTATSGGSPAKRNQSRELRGKNTITQGVLNRRNRGVGVERGNSRETQEKEVTGGLL